MAGIAAFLFSTVFITFVGEIVPQAYFARHALVVAGCLFPVLRVYRTLLWPIARPVGRLLDRWVGPEGIPWYREAELRDVLRQHSRSPESEIGSLEATGAINFLALDDLPVEAEGEPLDPRSVLTLPFRDGLPVFPRFEPSAADPFLQRLQAAGKKWVVVTDPAEEPRCVVDAEAFLRHALFGGPEDETSAARYRPLVVRDGRLPLGRVLGRLVVHSEGSGDDVIDEDLILLWEPEEKRIITGADILGRLLRGIVRVTETHPSGAS
jgi:metal transporter CNNM